MPINNFEHFSIQTTPLHFFAWGLFFLAYRYILKNDAEIKVKTLRQNYHRRGIYKPTRGLWANYIILGAGCGIVAWRKMQQSSALRLRNRHCAIELLDWGWRRAESLAGFLHFGGDALFEILPPVAFENPVWAVFPRPVAVHSQGVYR